MLNRRAHLVCYDLKPGPMVDRLVEVKNQFGVQRLRVKEHMQRLCVPSMKKVIE